MFWRSLVLVLPSITNNTGITFHAFSRQSGLKKVTQLNITTMILLTVYKESAGARERREFARLQDAIEFGQKTGSDYEIFDPITGKVIDWNEINVREDDGWYYDEAEFLWKRYSVAEETDADFPGGDFQYELPGKNRKLRCA